MQINPYQGSRIANARAGSAPIDSPMSGIRRIIGMALNINVNSALLDTPIPMLLLPGADFIIDQVWLNGASTSLTTATGGLFTNTGGTGTTLVSDAALSALTAVGVNSNRTLAGSVASTIFNQGQNAALARALPVPNTIYFRCGTAQGAVATVDCYIIGIQFP